MTPVAPYVSTEIALFDLPPMRIDAWLASSVLQKAIRRSETTVATRAALAYFRARGHAIWRRLQIIAAEDVGIGSLEAVSAAASSADPEWRAQIGEDKDAIIHVIRLLAEAPKDRSAEHLIRLCQSFPSYDEERDIIGMASPGRRLQVIADGNCPLQQRAMAAWFASGLNSSKERRLTGGDLPAVLDALRSADVPEQLLNATGMAARKTREPICLMPAIIWQEAAIDGHPPIVAQENLPASPLIGDIPSYALDKFTANGKAAIRAFARENPAVRTVLEAHVPDFRAHDAAAMAVFYSDGAPTALRCDWRGSHELEQLGTEQDLIGVGVAPEGVHVLLQAVRDNLAHLNEIRARLHRPNRSADQ